MNRIHKLLIPVICLVLASCSGGYDDKTCSRLADMVVRDDSLSQKDYSEMMVQYEAILQYLIDRADEIIACDDSERKAEMAQKLRDDEEYGRRFSYMFTFSSALYQAEVRDELDEKNLENYRSLERYTDEFAQRTEQL